MRFLITGANGLVGSRLVSIDGTPVTGVAGSAVMISTSSIPTTV